MISDVDALTHLWDRRDALRDSFMSAHPFPHVVIDGFLPRALASELAHDFPATDRMHRSRDYIFGSKHELSSVQDQGPAAARLADLALGEQMAALLSHVSGEPLSIDPRFHGGGFHQGTDGSFLDLHVDFNVHPLDAGLLRRLNVLIYLTPGWTPEMDGHLLLTDDPGHDPITVAPLFNRGVIMLTDSNTFHGYHRMQLPPGVARRSVALYAYREIEQGSVASRTTDWRPTGAGTVKKFAARHYETAVRFKSTVFGSRTARNR